MITDTISLYKVAPIQNAGINCLRITRRNNLVNSNPTIQILYGYNCFVQNTEVDSCFFSHITIEKSGNCEISGSYFHDAYDYGGGGRGYGVVMQYNSSDNKVENNIFNHLRHSILCQAGANGNVVDYNYSINPYWTGVSSPSNSAGDLVLHGNYVYANLFEGNICQNIIIDDSHGQNGPDNTFFRNRAKLYGIYMNSSPASNNQVFVGNEITSTTFLQGQYVLAGTGHFEYANKKQGTIVPANTGTLADVSYCYSVQPTFLSSANWPVIGIPNAYNTGVAPAEIRNQSLEKISCTPPPTNTSIEKYDLNKLYKITNPVHQNMKIFGPTDQLDEVEIISLLGKIVSKPIISENIDVSELQSGIYFIVLKYNGTVIQTQKIIFIK